MEHRTMPLFQLERAEGGPWGTLDLWQRKEMLVALLHPEGCAPCREVRAIFREKGAEWLRQEIGAVAVTMGREAQAGAVADPTGHVTGRLVEALEVSPGTAILAVADRYGDIYATAQVHGRPAGELIADALEWVDFIERQCPECGAPVDWA